MHFPCVHLSVKVPHNKRAPLTLTWVDFQGVAHAANTRHRLFLGRNQMTLDSSPLAPLHSLDKQPHAAAPLQQQLSAHQRLCAPRHTEGRGSGPETDAGPMRLQITSSTSRQGPGCHHRLHIFFSVTFRTGPPKQGHGVVTHHFRKLLPGL